MDHIIFYQDTRISIYTIYININSSRLICLFAWFIRLYQEFFPHMKRSPLPVKGCKCLPLLGTFSDRAVELSLLDLIDWSDRVLRRIGNIPAIVLSRWEFDQATLCMPGWCFSRLRHYQFQRMAGPFIWTNLNPLHPKDDLCQVWLKLASREENGNVKNLWQRRKQRQQLTLSENLTWASGSGELKSVTICRQTLDA